LLCYELDFLLEHMVKGMVCRLEAS
jgi:hypothetical protein